jgi:hypothetical protein
MHNNTAISERDDSVQMWKCPSLSGIWAPRYEAEAQIHPNFTEVKWTLSMLATAGSISSCPTYTGNQITEIMCHCETQTV